MEFKWESRSIGELFTLINGHAFKSSDFRNEGVPVLKIKNIKAGKINHEKLECVDQSYLEKYNEKITCYNDLLITMTGNRHDGNPETWVGKVAWWGNDSQYLINQRVGILRLNRDIQANARFLAYQLSSWPLQKHFISIATSSGGQANISPQQIYSVEITLPPLHVQNKIASFIGALEDKMQINYQTIFNLEQLSQTLFKRWFIDFEFPNEKGQPYKSSGGEMIESELGDIPKNWVVNSLSNIAEIVMGQSPKSDTYNNEKIGLPLLNGATDFRNRMLSPSKYTSDAKKIGCQGDYVFGVRATIGLVTELDDTYAIGRGSGIAKALYPEQKEYLYEILNKAFDEFQYTASGSVYLNISKNDLMYLKICQPPFDIFKKYHLSVNTIIIQKENLKRQNKNLIQLRDTLLPKLLSGEIEIPDELEV